MSMSENECGTRKGSTARQLRQAKGSSGPNGPSAFHPPSLLVLQASSPNGPSALSAVLVRPVACSSMPSGQAGLAISSPPPHRQPKHQKPLLGLALRRLPACPVRPPPSLPPHASAGPVGLPCSQPGSHTARTGTHSHSHSLCRASRRVAWPAVAQYLPLKQTEHPHFSSSTRRGEVPIKSEAHACLLACLLARRYERSQPPCGDLARFSPVLCRPQVAGCHAALDPATGRCWLAPALPCC